MGWSYPLCACEMCGACGVVARGDSGGGGLDIVPMYLSGGYRVKIGPLSTK